jgi:hypothetical protein
VTVVATEGVRVKNDRPDIIGRARELISDLRIRELERSLGKTVFRTVSGAHMYGFPSDDSDFDIRVVFVSPTEKILSLNDKPEQTKWFSVGLADLYLVEIEHFIRNMIKPNGNYLEWCFNPLTFDCGTYHEELKELAWDSLSRKLFNHYNHFSAQKGKEFEEQPTAKNLLYVIRTLMTGIHVLESGILEANLMNLVEILGNEDRQRVVRLVEQKAAAEGALMKNPEECLELIESLQSKLRRSRENSELPEGPSDRLVKKANHLLVRIRRENF